MAYTRSRARNEFENSTKKLKNVAKRVSFKSSPLNYEQKLLIYQSTIFLMSAKIEEYSRALIEDIVFNYKSKKATISEIPNNIITKTLIMKQLTYYNNYGYNSNEKKLLEDISCNNSYYSILNDDGNAHNNIHADIVIDNKKYPSVKNIDILYFRIGIDNIFSEINKRGKTNYKDKLKSFLSVREAIAHQEAPTLTYLDVDRHLNNLVELISQIDRVVYSHITKVSGSKYW